VITKLLSIEMAGEFKETELLCVLMKDQSPV
jgi:hypothetical protein